MKPAQWKTIYLILQNSMKIKGISNVRIGKYIEILFDNVTKEEAELLADESCRKLLANPNTETYKFELED